MTTIRHFIDGAETGSTDRTLPVFDPATGEAHRQVAAATAQEVEQAIASARAAQKAWRSSSLIKRADVFFRLRQILAERTDELAAIVTSEHGKVDRKSVV